MELLHKGINDGQLRNVNVEIFKLMYEASVEKLLMGDFLKANDIDYPEALSEVVDVMVDGIIKEK